MKQYLLLSLLYTGLILGVAPSALSQDKRSKVIAKKPDSETAEKKAQEKAAKEAADQEIALSLMQVPAYIGLTPAQARAQKAHDAAGFAQATQARNERWQAGYTTHPNPDTLTKLDRAYWRSERDYLHHIANLRDYAESLEKYDDVYSREELVHIRFALAIVERLTTPPAQESEPVPTATKNAFAKSKEQEKLERIAAILNS